MPHSVLDRLKERCSTVALTPFGACVMQLYLYVCILYFFSLFFIVYSLAVGVFGVVFFHCVEKSVCKFDDSVCGRYWIWRNVCFFVFLYFVLRVHLFMFGYSFRLPHSPCNRLNVQLCICVLKRPIVRNATLNGVWSLSERMVFRSFKSIIRNELHSAMFMANSCRPPTTTAINCLCNPAGWWHAA